MRKLGLRAEAAMARVELLQRRGGDLVHQGQRQLASAAGKALVVFDGGHHAARRLECFLAALAPDLGHRHEHSPKAGPPVAVAGRKVGPAEVGPPVRCQNRRQRPAPLPAHGRNRRLVARVHVRPLVAVDLDGHKVLVDQRGNLRVLIRLAVHHVAPVAPHRANVQQNRLVFRLSPRKGRLAPSMPPHRLMPRRAQIGGRSLGKRVRGSRRGEVVRFHGLSIHGPSPQPPARRADRKQNEPGAPGPSPSGTWESTNLNIRNEAV